jgi:uncharacterized delta-60 repeat protein
VRSVFSAGVAALVLAMPASAAPGVLDPGFAGKGWVRTYELGDRGNTFALGAEDVAIQPDGKIVATGEFDTQYGFAFGAYRYTAAGGLDRSFGGGGRVVTEIGGISIAHAVALQRDGKIILSGEVECSFGVGTCGGLARYLPNGALDPSFGNGGTIRTGFVGGRFRGLAIQPNGKIVAAGATLGKSGANFGIARFLPDGRLDRTFSRDGRAFVSFGRGRFDAAHALALQRDGRIVVAGESRVGNVGPPRFALARLTRRGALDRSFGSRGRRLTNPSPFGGFAKAVLVLPDGRILAAGFAYDSREHSTSGWGLVRYTARGRLDPSFRAGGIGVDRFGTGEDWAGALARQDDGKIVVAGQIYDDQAVARYLGR